MTITKKTHFNVQRKIVANMTTESWQDIPHVSYIYEPDVTEFLDIVKAMNENGTKKNKVTINTIMLKVISEGVKACPQVNAHIRYNSWMVNGSIKQIKEINMSIPWILPNGDMMTIKLDDMGERSLDNITDYIAETNEKIKNTNFNDAMYGVSLENTLKAASKGRLIKVAGRLLGAKTGKSKVGPLKGEEKREYKKVLNKLTKENLEQGTITVSNVGSVFPNQRGAVALLEIIPPQIFAVGISAFQKRPVVHTDANGNETIEVGQVMPMCLAFDHRALDFAEIIPFLQRLDDIFANPMQILNW